MKILNPIKVNNDLLKLLCSVLPDSTYHQFWYNSFLFLFSFLFFVCLLPSKSRHERARNERFYVRSWTSMNLIFCGLFRRTKGGIIIDTLCRTIYSKKRPCEKRAFEFNSPRVYSHKHDNKHMCTTRLLA